MIGKTNSITRRALTFDATATENSLLYGHTAYGADGTKLTGLGAYWPHAKQLFYTFWGSSTLTGAVEIYAPNATILQYTFAQCPNLTSVVLTTGNLTQCSKVFWQCYYLTSLVLNANTSNVTPTSFYEFLRDCTRLVSVTGIPIDMSSDTGSATPFYGCRALVTISFAPSTMKYSISFVSSPLLSTASLLSIANGLNAGTPATLTMHATSKTNMDAIMVDNNAGVAELGSAMTLSAFINDIKGWTIA